MAVYQPVHMMIQFNVGGLLAVLGYAAAITAVAVVCVLSGAA